jgi:hypothetical protein
MNGDDRKEQSMTYPIQVWKVQLPIGSNLENPPAFIYREGREDTQFIPVDRELLEWFKQDEKLIYVNARMTKKGLKIIERVAEQEW